MNLKQRKRPGRPFTAAMWNGWLRAAAWAQLPDATTLRLRQGIQEMRSRLAGGVR